MTPKERAAMQQALEALEEWKSEYNCNDDDEAITALRSALAESEALEQPVSQEPVACVDSVNTPQECVDKTENNRHAQPVSQEPVAWKPIETAPRHGRILVTGTDIGTCVASAGWDTETPDDIRWCVVNDIVVKPTHWMPLPTWNRPFIYPAPQPVKEVELTDDEIAQACGWKFSQPMYEWVIGLARTVIAAYKEKNK